MNLFLDVWESCLYLSYKFTLAVADLNSFLFGLGSYWPCKSWVVAIYPFLGVSVRVFKLETAFWLKLLKFRFNYLVSRASATILETFISKDKFNWSFYLVANSLLRFSPADLPLIYPILLISLPEKSL